MANDKNGISELRRDPVSGEWVIISTGRAKRPDSFKSKFSNAPETPLALCPFENPREHDNEVVKVYRNGNNNDWALQVVKNKFPIIQGLDCGFEKNLGLYAVKNAAGMHEVVIFRDHKKSLAELDVAEIELILSVYRERYEELKKLECVEYILVIHNHGREAGASISHPHSQILALPFTPADIKRSLFGSKRYFAEHGRCVHCDVLEFELKNKKRVIWENELFAVIVPFAPKFSYEVRIFPKKHLPFFEEIEEGELAGFAEALKTVLAKIRSGLDDPAYNFFIHTPPADHDGEYDYYHWHLEIVPRLKVWGGFELGTGGDVIDIDPDEAAEYLRGVKI